MGFFFFPVLHRCLDEWDVYLDELARSKIEQMIYESGENSGYQHIFFR